MSMPQSRVLHTISRYVERVHEERRAQARVPVDRPVEVWTRRGARVPVTLRDLSPDAVQIRCDRDRAARLHPTGAYVAGALLSEVFLGLRLPGPDGISTDVVIPCHMTYFSVREDDSVAIGLAFDAPCESTYRAVEQLAASGEIH